MGLSQEEFARRFDLLQGIYSKYERGSGVLSAIEAARIAKETSTNPLWLILGDGRQPLESAPDLTKPVEVRAVGDEGLMPAVLDRRLAEAIAALTDEYEELNERGQEALLIRFWDAHPDPRQRSERGRGRQVARLAGG